MSNCNYSHLCWGFPLLDEDGEPLEILSNNQDYDEFIAAKFGIKKPTVPYEGNEAVFRSYNDNVSNTVHKAGIQLIEHDIDDEHGVPILTVSDDQGNHQASSHDKPTSLPPLLEVKSEWRGRLQEFCLKANLPFQEPHWVLAVSWDH